MDSPNHKVSIVKTLSAEDYAELWSLDLENANRHSNTEIPIEILNILKKTVKDKAIIRKTMKSLYNEEIGV